MSTATQTTQNVSPLTYDSSVHTDVPVDDAKLYAGSKEPMTERGTIDRKMSDTLEQILEVLRGSTIAEERGKDVESKFWATYKRVSNEYDDDFLERANDDMAIILTFAGLFSAVNSTFIIGMQPNPGVTTNILMVQMMQILVNGPDAGIDIGHLSSSTDYPSSTVWMQTLAYASLSFSVLAAFGAVMGKQWLNSYKAARGRGSLEERGLQRQRKLDGLEHWRLRKLLGAFFVLLQISLVLFGLSLSANMFTQQRTISSVVICSTAFGVLSYLSTILISVSHPDSPFHTAGSSLVGAICKSFLRARSTLTPDVTFGRSSAIRWILETSTNSEVVETAAAMIPRLQWPQKLDASTVYARLLDNYAAYANKPELSVTYGKAIAHLLMQSVKVNPPPMITYHSMGDRSRFIRDAFMDARLAWDRFKAADNEDVRQKHKADARTALRTMLVHGLRYRLSFPDNEKLIWDGDLRWQQNNGLTPCSVDFDWLIDYLLDKVNHSNDYEAEGDALLALSAMHGLGSSAKRSSYVDTLVRCMDPTRPRRVRYAAFRAVSDAGDELASITNSSTSQSVDPLDKLSRALLPAIRPDHNPTTHDGTSENSFEALGNRCYLRLIFALAKNEGWCERLTRDGHIKWCISLVDQVLVSPFPLDRFYLAVIFLRIDPSGKYISPDPWRTLIKSAWNQLDYLAIDDAHIIGALPALVTATRQNLPDAKDVVALKELTKDVNWVLRMLKEKQGAHYQADDLVDAALLHVQGLYDELSAASLTVG